MQEQLDYWDKSWENKAKEDWTMWDQACYDFQMMVQEHDFLIDDDVENDLDLPHAHLGVDTWEY